LVACGGEQAVPSAGPPHSGLPPELIQKTIRDNFGAVRKCYEDGLRTSRVLTGRIVVRFVIEGDGHIASAQEDPKTAPFPDPDVASCIVARFNELKFPPTDNGKKITVVYPINLSPSESAPSAP
jgi:hypothetical protein